MQRHRYVWLLISLIIVLILSPLLEYYETSDLIISLLYSLLVLSSANAASDSRTHLLFALSLAIIWFFLQAFGHWFSIPHFTIMKGAAMICLLYFTIYVILRPLLKAKETNFNMLCGAISGYLLIGVAWAVSYGMFEALRPGSFTLLDPDSTVVWSQFLYFSLTTLTTLGYGDLTPLTPSAGIWATLEAVAGTLYVAVLIARLVSLVRS